MFRTSTKCSTHLHIRILIRRRCYLRLWKSDGGWWDEGRELHKHRSLCSIPPLGPAVPTTIPIFRLVVTRFYGLIVRVNIDAKCALGSAQPWCCKLHQHSLRVGAVCFDGPRFSMSTLLVSLQHCWGVWQVPAGPRATDAHFSTEDRLKSIARRPWMTGRRSVTTQHNNGQYGSESRRRMVY